MARKTGSSQPRTDQALHSPAEAMQRGKRTSSLEQFEALSPEATRTVLRELHAHQVEMEMQNEELRRAQVELETSLARYAEFYDMAPVGYITVSEKGLNLEANLTAAAMLGMARDGLIKQPFFRFILKQHQDIYCLLRKKILETAQPQSCELQMVKYDGTQFWVHLSATAAHGRDGAPELRLVLKDITARKQAEAALHESEERYRRIVQMADEGVWTINADSLTDYVNPKMAQMMGYKEEEMIGRPIDDFLDDDGRAMLAYHIKRRKGGMADQFEFKYLRKDGSSLCAYVSTNPITDANGVYVGAMALLTDISARRDAETTMRESETQFRAIFEQAAVGVAMIDSNTGRFLKVNQRACDITRLTREQMLAENFMNLTHPDDLRAELENMKKLKAGRISTFTMEKRCLHPEGGITWINVTVSPMWLPGEAPTRHIAVVEDITARKQVEVALTSTADLLSRTGEMAKIGGWELDLKTMKLFWSLETCRIFEIDLPVAPSLEEAIIFYAPEARPQIQAAVQTAIDKGTAYELELRVITAKGRSIWARSQGAAVLEGGKVVKLIGAFQDITERKQAELALRESEAKFRAIFDQAAVGVALIDSNTGRFLNVNQRICEIIGMPQQQLMSATFMDITHPDDLPAAMEQVRKLRAGLIRSYTMEKRNLLPDGTVKWVNLSVAAMWQPGEAPTRQIAVVEDISDRKNAEAKYLRELKFNKTLVNHTSVIIVLLDLQGHMVHVNDATVNILGYGRKELIGRTPWEVGIMSAEEKVRALERLQVLLKGGKNPPRETILTAKNGQDHVFSLSSISTSSPDGTIDRIIVTGTDLTERNRLQREILKISEQEQARIGHNLHDGVGQTMTGVASLMEALESELDGEQRTSAARIRELVQVAIQEIRRMSHSMSPAAVKNRGLGGVLQLLADTIRINHRTPCTFKIDPGIHIRDSEKETHIYRIAQEAANNALRHGRPSKITISLRRLGNKACELKIEDDGSGIKKTKNGASEGIGLQVMDYRANLIGGTLKIASKPRRGVSVTCRFPCTCAPGHGS